ncbi:MAG: putative 2-aminoethylphosphonate ABC transporter permease subunit [Desulfobacterales bacterium]|nr:putative 2-aminoethylphosphonate ABC transporter permease subunit [Desulfobacterales bacterium]
MAFHKKRVVQKSGFDDWIRRGLIALACLWLLVGVILPLLEVVNRATHSELPVKIQEPTDQQESRGGFSGQVDVAGRTILLMKENEQPVLYIDGKPVPLIGGSAEYDGVWVLVENDQIGKVACSRARSGMIIRTILDISPITITKDPSQHWLVDGQKLDPAYNFTLVKRFIGLVNFFDYFGNKGLSQSVWNSISVAVWSTIISVILAFIYAYGMNRTRIRGKWFFQVTAMIPLFAPTMLYGLSLVYLFGNKGVLTTGFFDKFPWLAWDIGLYGFTGIVIAEVVFSFPPAFMILLVALSNTDARLYEASESLGAGKIRTFFTVTVPGVKFGLLSAVFVCFTLSFTDFGAPKVVGGQYNILAVDIYKQVIGQQNFGMGATVSIILLVPTVIAFIADRLVQKRSVAVVTSRSIPFSPEVALWRDTLFFIVCSLIAAFILIMVFTAGLASFVKMWPYGFSHPDLYPQLWTLENYLFSSVGGGGYNAFFNSIRIALFTALFGTAITFVSAYLIEKTKGVEWLKQFAYFLSIIPLALPGLVLGIAYIFFFNNPRIEIPFTGMGISNPFNRIYGTVTILVICNIIHFYTVSFLTATTALRQLDKEFEAVSESMSVPFYTTFFRVTVPVCLPAIFEIAAFYFVSAMATVSAVIFLYTSDLPIASVAVVNMDDAGDTAPAAAMCMLIVMANILVRGLVEMISHFLRKKTQVWRKK